MKATWQNVRLGEIAAPVARADSPQPGKTYRQIGVKLWGEGAYEREPMDGSQTKYRQLFRSEKDDIIVNKIWARSGSVAVVPESLAGCYGSGEFPMFAPNRDRLDPCWMHWLTKTRGFWTQCDEKSQGTSGKNRIRPERFLDIGIPLPPLAEQRRVVARIEELAAQIHEARALRQQAAEEAESLQSLTVSRLYRSSQWDTITVGSLVGADSLRNGKSVKSLDTGNGIRCLTLSSMRRGRIDIRESKPVPLTATEAKPYLVRKGDVFVVRGNGSKDLCGLAGLVVEDSQGVIFPDLFIRIPLSTDRMLPEFFVALWNSAATRQVIEEKAKTTSGIWKINQGHIASTQIPIPPIAEQCRIVADLNALQAKLDALKRLQADSAAELDALLPSILDSAFNGQL
jgi:type I restriction enzyme S subunit